MKTTHPRSFRRILSLMVVLATGLMLTTILSSSALAAGPEKHSHRSEHVLFLDDSFDIGLDEEDLEELELLGEHFAKWGEEFGRELEHELRFLEEDLVNLDLGDLEDLDIRLDLQDLEDLRIDLDLDELQENLSELMADLGENLEFELGDLDFDVDFDSDSRHRIRHDVRRFQRDLKRELRELRSDLREHHHR